MMRYVKHGIRIGSAVWLSFLVFGTTGDAPVTVGHASLPAEQMEQIFARGECPDVLQPQSCGPQAFCDSNNCSGDPFNPYDDCLAACKPSCFSRCESDYEGDPQAIQDCKDWCTSTFCPESCQDYPDRDVRDCGSAVPSEKIRNYSNWTPAIYDAESSDYEDVQTEMRYCYRVCGCSQNCYWVKIAEPNVYDWVCQTTTDCTDSGEVEHATDSTAGTCPEDPGS